MLLSTFSSNAIGMRADTPDFWSTNSLLRASNVTSSISSLK